MTFADKIISFNRQLDFKDSLPDGIRVMNPFEGNTQIHSTISKFYKKFYNDNNLRHLILGINPGRFGAGVTGIPFTDTKRLNEKCEIQIQGFKTHEPSSVFIYEVIEAYGGVYNFYSDFYINSVCPLGFTFKNNKEKEVNYNYYDSKALADICYNFIIQSISKQLEFGIKRDVCFCLGTGYNAHFLVKLNEEQRFFKKIISLEHPRYIMQYKLKFKQDFIDTYLEKLNNL